MMEKEEEEEEEVGMEREIVEILVFRLYEK
jgi:hypothetical protein